MSTAPLKPTGRRPSATGDRQPPPGRLLTRAAVGWIVYDFANTIFSYAVVTRYFNEWIVIERGHPDWVIGAMSFGAFVLLLVTLPFFGALADRSGRRKPLLVALTLVCVGACALLSVVDALVVALVVAGVAIYGFQGALAQYDPLLAAVAPPERRGTISGLGVGAGYVAVFVALFGFGALVPEGETQRAFWLTALLFLLFALPCFAWVRDAPAARSLPATPATKGLGLARSALVETAASVRRARGRPHGRFLLARFLYVDAIATVIAFMTVYARRVAHLSDGELQVLFGLSIGFAAVGAVASGLLVERVGARRVLVGTIVLVSGALFLAGVTGAPALLWVAGPAVGVALGAVWTSDRVLLLRLSPAGREGEVFGLYALVGRASSGVGPLVLWGGTVWLLSDALAVLDVAEASRAALCVLAASALLGVLVLRGVAGAEAAPPAV